MSPPSFTSPLCQGNAFLILVAVLALVIVTDIEVADAVVRVSLFNDVLMYVRSLDLSGVVDDMFPAQFDTQTTVACAGFPPTNSQGNGIFAAAMSDLSPLWQGATCQGIMVASKCNGHGSCVDCVGRGCRYLYPASVV
ncbi:hypothetical protein BN946_scf184845.g67 [Trametes cinnabarina]|uniref:Uncharacterized protein n=1 Tax=Pycnoporus cinnabarinus TaxID=5643 RepID=A0A060SAC4_PYCCI|nr:hypothetical protein BN946_scf184845.g67 [Trametes cinnabarina]